MQKRRKEESLFEDFMDYVKRRQEDSPHPAKRRRDVSPHSNSSSEWPTEYLDLSNESILVEDSDQEREEEEGGRYSQEDQEVEAQEGQQVKQEEILQEDEIDEELLKLLGKDKECGPERNPKIHAQLAKRWNNIIEKGMDKDEKSDIFKKYPPIENIPLLITAKLNPEAEGAMSEPAKKRDRSISSKQKQVAVAISALGSVLSEVVCSKENFGLKKMAIERISDAGRVLCELFHQENKVRRFCALESLNKELRHSLQQREPAEYLFGKDLAEGVRTAKAIAKTAQDLKIKSTKNRTLNAQGPPRGNLHRYQHQPRNNVGRGQVQKKSNFQQRKDIRPRPQVSQNLPRGTRTHR